jgi:hypothetical protein
LSTSFVVEPGAALDSIDGDGVVVTILQKRKRQPVEKKRTRWSTLEWRRRLSTGRSYFGRPIAAKNSGFPVMFLLAFSSSCVLSNSADGIQKKTVVLSRETVTPPNNNKFGGVTTLYDNNETKTIEIWA